MSAMLRTFKWEDHDNFGEGWVPQFFEGADPVSAGFTAAHDCLEHFPDFLGGLEGEMMAFGSMHYVRRYFDFSNKYRYSDIFMAHTADIGSFIYDRLVSNDGVKCRDPGKFNASRLYNFDDATTLIAIRAGIMDGIKEYVHGGEEGTKTEVLRMLPHKLDQRLLGWMVKGYREATSRFGSVGLDEMDMLEIFTEVSEEFEKAAKRDGEIGFDDIIDVSVNFKQRKVRVTRRSEWND